MIAIRLAAIVALALAPVPAAAQDEAALGARYESAVTALQRHHDFAPMQGLAQDWTHRQFETAVATSRRDSPEFSRAAALLHLEIAARVVERSAGEALFHIHLGERVLSSLAVHEAAVGDFVARWSVVASSVFLARTDVHHARAALRFGLDRRPRDARVHMAAGTIDDLASLAIDVEGPPQLERRAAIAAQNRARLLTRAEQEYRAALALAPDLAQARVRLGRILSRRERLDDARVELESIGHTSLTTGDGYLRLLFLSEVHEGLGNVRRARAHLEEAVRIAGDRQGSWMALAQLEERDGRVDRARAIVAQGLSRRRPDVTDEWWEYRNGRFDQEGMAWLRDTVWR